MTSARSSDSGHHCSGVVGSSSSGSMSMMGLLCLLDRTSARRWSAPAAGMLAARRWGGPPVGCGTAMTSRWGLPSALRIALAPSTVSTMATDAWAIGRAAYGRVWTRMPEGGVVEGVEELSKRTAGAEW